MQGNKKSDPQYLAFETILFVFRKLYGFSRNGHFDPKSVTLTDKPLVLPRLPAEFDGYRLVHFSDIHIGTWVTRARLEGIVDQVNRLQPDLIAITGDFVTFEPEKFAQDLVESLRELKSTDGTVAILGNHDHWTNPKLVREVFAASGIMDLSNRVYSLEREGRQLHIAGVDDMQEGLDRLDLVLEQLPPQGAAILLAHEPDYADISAASKRFDLQLSGHTHGGQVVFPVIGPKVLPRGGRKYPNGLYQVGDMIQYTSRGVGTTPLQMRFNCTPEITLFTLRSPEKKEPSPADEKAPSIERNSIKI